MGERKKSSLFFFFLLSFFFFLPLCFERSFNYHGQWYKDESGRGVCLSVARMEVTKGVGGPHALYHYCFKLPGGNVVIIDLSIRHLPLTLEPSERIGAGRPGSGGEGGRWGGGEGASVDAVMDYY